MISLQLNDQKMGLISRIPSAQLYASGAPTADIVLSGSGINDVQSMAFDASGNLWITHKEKKAVIKLNAAAITTSSTTLEAAVTIICESKPPVTMTLSGPTALAFDKQSNLWVGYFGPNVIAMIPVSQQSTTAIIKPAVQIKLSAGVLIHQISFDESGALWTAMANGKFGKLNAEQLSTGGKKTPDIMIASPDVKYASGIAFYPIPEGLPLH